MKVLIVLLNKLIFFNIYRKFFMKRLFLILVLLFVYSSAFAQDTEYTVFSPPKVTAEMFEGEAFEDDEDAYAVYLHHCATSMLELVYSKPYRIVKYKGRIRVYKEKGVETYGDDFFKITYNSKNGGQEIRNIVLKCYNINEKGKIKVSETKKKEFVESEYKDKENDIERTTIKVPIKDLKVGSIIDWEYERYTPGQSPAAGWGFQKSVPILYSEYIYQNLSLLDLDRIENGDYFIDEDEEYEGKSIFIDLGQRAQKYSTIVTYTNVADVPAFPDTRYYDNLNEYIANFSFRVKGVTQGGEYHPYTTPWNEIIEKSLEVNPIIEPQFLPPI
ncbi:MAG: hypothetical protein B6I17_04485 [Tenericutes bacterium 4572_104]|nr:MAG: hypothetical protein B6I17_04485 [Tenericutes bacterium 4572_104]